jgi:hypothetical protein
MADGFVAEDGSTSLNEPADPLGGVSLAVDWILVDLPRYIGLTVASAAVGLVA